MAYTNAWTNTWAGTNAASSIDNRISQILVDIEQRMDNILGDTSWSAGTDPTIDGTVRKSIKAITTALASVPTINATTGVVPKKSGAGAFSDSDINENTTGQVIVATKVLTVTAQPRLYGANTSGTVASGAAVPWDSVTSTGLTVASSTRITVPTDGQGIYLFVVCLKINTNVTATNLRLKKNGVTELTQLVNSTAFGTTPRDHTITWIGSLAAADYVEVILGSSASNVDFIGSEVSVVKVA